ncbi:SMI1/KNR4 family protein [Peribacillus saganii]|uniref:SMI1/KNR4 family protein n=1 Tax=Peribacillus saganii TaxID=2303992 RepID=A0A372LRX6_9BACI|nr:SMI1/KNR4 family protein [Peribacillus saganii]RFU70953.1 SMI1/KNR4 family protein [Peribacillus saganii]
MENTIWREDTDEYKLKPLTAEMVKKAEEELKIKLPESYIKILKEQNGGYIKFDAHPSDTPNSWADDHVNVEHILGIGEEDGILESSYLIEEWDLPDNVVLISGDGHSWIALDYRKTKEEPPVIFIDTDSEQIFELAPNFHSFLNGLTIWEDDMDLDEPPEPKKKGFFGRFFGK